MMRSFTRLMVLLVAVNQGAAAQERREFVLAGTVRAKVTAYCPCRICCGKHADGRTATGRDARGPGAAVDPRVLPYGSILRIPGAGYQEADDTGGAMRQSWRRRRVVHIDLRLRTHAAARRWGVRWLEVAVYRPAPTCAAAPSGRRAS